MKKGFITQYYIHQIRTLGCKTATVKGFTSQQPEVRI